MPLVPFMMTTSLNPSARRQRTSSMHTLDTDLDVKPKAQDSAPITGDMVGQHGRHDQSAPAVRKANRSKRRQKRGDAVTPTKKLPVTLLSGFLGAGKSTLLKHLLTSNRKMRIAVIVNDMAELNIDTKFIENSGFVQTKQEIVSLQNGCICCTLRTDLIREINNLQRLGTFDYLIIESTGIAEPMQVAESFVFNADTMEVAENPSEMLWNVAKLDTCVSVVDVSLFPSIVRSTETVVKSFPTEFDNDQPPGGEGLKPISQLLIEQVEFANVIILNKMDLLTSSVERETITKLVKTLNPSARIVEATYGRIDPSQVLDTGLFDMDVMSNTPGWLQSLAGESGGEKDEYGISSFVFRARRPFHPERIRQLMASLFVFSDDLSVRKRKRETAFTEDGADKRPQDRFGSILRSKGFGWIAGRDRYAAEWNHNGRILSLVPAFEWYCLRPDEDWEVPDIASVKADFMPPYGDRRQEIVFIGTNLLEAELTSALNGCLLTDEEMGLHEETVLLSEERPLFYGARNALVDRLPAWTDIISETTHWTTVLRPEQHQTFQLGSGVSMVLRHISLDFLDHSRGRDKTAVKVWLESAEGMSLLLCTMRPIVTEQCSTAVRIPAGREESPQYLLRLEVVCPHSSGVELKDSIAVYLSTECTFEGEEVAEEQE